MAFTVNLKIEGSRTDTIEGVRFVDTYQVISDVSTSTRTQAVQAWVSSTGYDIGVSHSEASGSVVETITTNRSKSDRKEFTIIASFGPKSIDNEESSTAPENRRVKRSWRSVAVEKETTKDRDGNPLVNTADIPFDPPVQINTYNGVTTFQRYLTTFDDDDALDYVGHLNSATFLGKPAETVLCIDIDAQEEYVEGTLYYLVSYVFQYNPDGWQFESLSTGTCVMGDDGEPEDILDENGNPVTEPVPLDSDGEPTTSDNAATVIYDMIPTANFNPLVS